MTIRRSRAALFAALFSTTSLIVAPAFAQDEGDEDTGIFTLLQRIVFGAGEEKVAIDTPQAVTVITQEDLDQEAATTVAEVFDKIPNASVGGSSANPLGQAFNIRGIGNVETSADEGRIIVNVDGVPQFYEQYRMGGFFNDTELFKRVEVLRGPASSTLYGSGALGGIVNFTTKDASDFLGEGDTVAIKQKFSYDTNPNSYLVSGIAAMRFSDYAEILLSGSYRRAEKYRDAHDNEITGSEFETPSGLAKATFYLNDSRERVVRASYSHFNSNEDDTVFDETGASTGFGTVDREVDNRQAILSLEDTASDNPWLDYKLQLSWNDISNRQDDASSAAFGSLWQDADYGYESYQFLGENTVGFTGENWENYLTFGTQINYQERTAGTETALGFHPEGTDLLTGAFVQSEFIWNEKLTLIPGIRVDRQKLEADESVGDVENQTEIAVSPKIAALYDFSDNFSLFGSYAHTERLPTLDEIFSNDYAGTTSPPNYSLDLEKEKSDNFELGGIISGDDILIEGDRFDFKATSFINDVKDYIRRSRNDYPQYTNDDHVRLYGAELEAAYDSERVFASGAAALTYGENLETDEFVDTIAPPEISLTLGIKFPDHGIRLGWDGRFVAESADPMPAPGDPDTDYDEESRRRGAFHKHDLFVSWSPDEGSDLSGWSATARVENVLDTHYQEYLSNDTGKGRTFKISISKTTTW